MSALLLLAARLLPLDRLPALCAVRRLVGLPCPTCGCTRAFVRVMRGGFGDAWVVSPLGTMLAVAALATVGWWLLRQFIVRRPIIVALAPRQARLGVALGLLLVGANWLYLLCSRAAG